MNTKVPRRPKGEGTVSRYHNHPTCPPVGPDGVRPPHTCKGPYRARVWVEDASGHRFRKELYGPTVKVVMDKKRRLLVDETKGAVVRTRDTVESWFRTDADELGLDNWWTGIYPDLKVNTRKRYGSAIRTWIIPNLGAHRLDKLTPDHVKALYRKMRAAGLSESSVHLVHSILSAALKAAMVSGKVHRNVTQLVEAPVQDSQPRKPLALGHAWKVLDAAGDDPRWWSALWCGVRQGEALGLYWPSVHLDPEDCECELDEEEEFLSHLITPLSLAREPGVGLVMDRPKSNASTNRYVPLPGPVADRFRIKRTAYLEAGGDPHGIVFGTVRGTPLDPTTDYRAWCALLEKAGVPHYELHAARNTTAHLLEDAGVHPRLVAEILGHTNVAMTYRYQFGNVGGKNRAMGNLTRYMEAAQTKRNGRAK